MACGSCWPGRCGALGSAIMDDRIGVLFVCLGNICRSPLAEAIFMNHAAQRGTTDAFDIDSAGTGAWHVGERADRRSISTGRAHGITVASIARKVNPDRDFARFDRLIAMDRSNRSDLISMGAQPQRVELIRSFDPMLDKADERSLDVPDPYYGPGDGFERVYAMLDAACAGLLDTLLAE